MYSLVNHHIAYSPLKLVFAWVQVAEVITHLKRAIDVNKWAVIRHQVENCYRWVQAQELNYSTGQLG